MVIQKHMSKDKTVARHLFIMKHAKIKTNKAICDQFLTHLFKCTLAKKLKHARIDFMNYLFFSFPICIDKGKPFTACTGSVPISLKSRFQLMNSKVIKHDLENLPCCMGDFIVNSTSWAHVLPSLIIQQVPSYAAP